MGRLRTTLITVIVMIVLSPVTAVHSGNTGVAGIDLAVKPHDGTVRHLGSTPSTSTPRWLIRASRSQLTRIPPKWQRLAHCESRMRIHAIDPTRTYYGLWQIHKGWFRPFHINPKTATITQQYKIAQHVYAKQGAQAWSCAKRARFH